MVEYSILSAFSYDLEMNYSGLESFHGILYIVEEYALFFLCVIVRSRHLC